MTPLRRQYLDIKGRYPGMLLLFQIGGFYETFDEDARTLARELGLVLTRKWFGRGDVRPLAGIPVRALQTHLQRLLRRGHRVVLCAEVSPPGKGLVRRDVVRVITPGTVVGSGAPAGAREQLPVHLVTEGDRAGLCCADVSTGELRMTELSAEDVAGELGRLRPAELLDPESLRLRPAELADLCSIAALADGHFALAAARRTLLQHFAVATLEAYGCDEQPLGTRAAGALIAYLRDGQPDALAGLGALQSYTLDGHLQLPPEAVRDLGLLPPGPLSPEEPGRTLSLVEHLDRTATPMGARLLRAFVRRPLRTSRLSVCARTRSPSSSSVPRCVRPCGTNWRASGTWSGSWAACGVCSPRPARCGRWGRACAPPSAPAACCARAAPRRASWMRSSPARNWPTSSTGRLTIQPAAAALSGPASRRSSTACASPWRAGVPRQPRGTRAAAHRHLLAQGRLQ